ncbi:uncharacterized protein LOC131074569 [Cryptomeria japonica]|uniref:uncharacterized protein LOC131074569 n=1 Tax=Cryptomeria japonica TaxID=3369 RepID=UPI0027DA6B59|nr:uncharacterized protein LOC131074569 [Cryptomeria japonica]XP_057867190.2 uncharacterized protein LOC131074569 [Cryptomeria japonica]
MWSFASNAITGTMGFKDRTNFECSDDEVSSRRSTEEGLECPICWESFNIVENVPYVLWCGHTLCKNCVLGLQWATVKFPTLPVQLPLFISCPWCQLLSFRLVWKGSLKFPRKNFFLLWMVESMNGDRRLHGSIEGEHGVLPTNGGIGSGNVSILSDCSGRHSCSHAEHSSQRPNGVIEVVRNYLNSNMLHASFRKSLLIFVQMTAKFPLVIVFLLIVLYVIPASAAILALYCLITILFALPSFLILYFSYPSLDWLVREIVT